MGMAFIYKLTLILEPKHRRNILQTQNLTLVFLQYERQNERRYLDDLGDLVEGLLTQDKKENQKVAQRLRQLGFFQFSHFFSEIVVNNVKRAEMGETLQDNPVKEKIRYLMRKHEKNFVHGKNQCVVCGNTKSLKRCSRCFGVVYCGRECQRADWRRHKPLCRPTS